MNYNSTDIGAGCIGRMGALASFATRRDIIIAKIDPITETLQRGEKGFCVLVSLFGIPLSRSARRERKESSLLS